MTHVNSDEMGNCRKNEKALLALLRLQITSDVNASVAYVSCAMICSMDSKERILISYHVKR